jgi:hypothetical protein
MRMASTEANICVVEQRLKLARQKRPSVKK